MMGWLRKPRIPTRAADIGKVAEQLARELLESNGLSTIAQNYRSPWGEIDLVMRDGAYLVFVEVRYRRETAWGKPLETIDRRKQSRITRTALHYLSRNPALADRAQRFDVVAVSPRNDSVPELDWIKDAFQPLG